MRLIDADELKKAIHSYENRKLPLDTVIDNAPTVEIPNYGGQVVPDTLQGWRYEERPQGEFSIKELEGWLTSCGYASGTVEDKVKEFKRYIERSREDE